VVMTMSKMREGRKIPTEMGMRRMLSPLLFNLWGRGRRIFLPTGTGMGRHSLTGNSSLLAHGSSVLSNSRR